jgi:hypothetical protein
MTNVKCKMKNEERKRFVRGLFQFFKAAVL